MKKLFALLLALAMVFSLAACGGGDDEKPPSNDDKTPNSSEQQTSSSKPDESNPAESQQSTDGQPSGEEKEPLVKNVGDTVEHGSFEGLTLEWLTLAIDEENEKALLVTKDIIAHWVYDSAVMEDVTWETSDIREWLNGTFYDGAFSEQQKACILESEIVNSANPVTGTESGADTVDIVFLLSYEEAQTYFPTDESRQACYNFSQEYMAYLAKMMADTPNLEMTEQEALDELDGYNNGTDWPDSWWLRTSGDGQQTAAGVESDGVITEYHNQVWAAHGIRPAIWVDLSGEWANPDADQQDGDQVDLSGFLGTKTGKFYSQFADSRMYMEYEMEMEGQTMTIISATDGDRTYSETKMGGTSMGVSIMIGEDMYTIDHAGKMVIKMSLGTDTQTIAGAVLEESDVDMGDYKTGTREIDGKTYDTEEWIVEGASSIMCFDGDDLAYMIGAFEGEEVVMKIIEVSHDVDDSLFEIPDDYTVMEI